MSSPEITASNLNGVHTADVVRIITEFCRDLGRISDLHALNERIVAGLSQCAHCPQAMLFVLEREQEFYRLAWSQGLLADEPTTLRWPTHHPLPRYLANLAIPVYKADLRENPGRLNDGIEPVVAALDELDVHLCVPLLNKQRLIGFCAMGPPACAVGTMENPITSELLSAFAQNAANALDHAMLYEDLQRSQALMRRTDRLRSLEIIAGGFAHEIRNPLTSIKTFVQLAPERKDDAAFISEFSRVVMDDVYRIERLIQEILDYARYMEPKLTEEDLNELVSSCLYFVEVQANSVGVIIEKDLAGDIPRVMLDRQQIKQVLLNLLLNAMDAMSERGGRLRVSSRTLTKASGGLWVQIEVQDSGPGIPAANLEHIFDPFFTTKHDSDEHEGTGLGLTIAHQIVQEHSGEIQVTSMEGTGTTFFVNVPAVEQS
ncbi:MAG: ATP-binding protein [Nitrospiraceae bacterium]